MVMGAFQDGAEAQVGGSPSSFGHSPYGLGM